MTYSSGDQHRRALSFYHISKYLSKYINPQGLFLKLVLFKAYRPNKTGHLEVTVLRATKNIINVTRTKDFLPSKW